MTMTFMMMMTFSEIRLKIFFFKWGQWWETEWLHCLRWWWWHDDIDSDDFDMMVLTDDADMMTLMNMIMVMNKI